MAVSKQPTYIKVAQTPGKFRVVQTQWDLTLLEDLSDAAAQAIVDVGNATHTKASMRVEELRDIYSGHHPGVADTIKTMVRRGEIFAYDSIDGHRWHAFELDETLGLLPILPPRSVV